MDKKIVFLPYDFDTACGINNEGSLVFSYNLEDIDQTESGADIFNGQQSVLWKNLRETFGDELKAMYQQLRSAGALSYEKVERMFEEHQAKWPEAVFNEDAWFKYLAPLEEKGSAAYLAMLQGSKAEQRKWWLYNRFRYIDSKYNAGDALTDVITLRGYAKADITVRPYADVYATIKYGSYLVQTRAARNQSYTLSCPLDNVNDTEIYIYSASQLADVGDLSGLKVGYAEFVYASKLQSLKLGDADPSYDNGNLQTLYLGNSRLLKTLDVRNCSGLGTGDQKTVDLSGCTGIEEAFFEGTNIAGVTLPNGGVLKTLHLPGTVTSLEILNQTAITDFSCPDLSNISTLRLENVPQSIDTMEIVNHLKPGSRVRIFGFYWELENTEGVEQMLDTLDTMRGLDQNGSNTDKAQIYGTIHVPYATGEVLASCTARYPDVTFAADHVTATIYYYNGDELIGQETIVDGARPKNIPGDQTRSDAHYTYTFVGWTTEYEGEKAERDVFKDIRMDRKVYAAYSRVVKTYRVRFYNGNVLVKTFDAVPYGTTVDYPQVPVFNGDGDPDDYEFLYWSPDATSVPITGNTDCRAEYKYIGFMYTKYLSAELAGFIDEDGLTAVRDHAFQGFTKMKTLSMPELKIATTSMCANCTSLVALNLPKVTRLRSASLSYLTGIEVLYLPSVVGWDANANPITMVQKIKELRLPSFTGSIGYDLWSINGYPEIFDLGMSSSPIIRNEPPTTKCKHLIMRSATMVETLTTLAGASPLRTAEGAIYVPRTLVDTYKASEYWGSLGCQVLAIEDHPEICECEITVEG